MRRWTLAFLGAAALSAGCDTNPLLQMAEANYSPVVAGSTWIYKSPDLAHAETTVVSVGALATVQGRAAYPFTVAASGTTTHNYTYDVNVQSGAMDVYDPNQAAVGWFLWRRLPYEPGDSWPAAKYIPDYQPVLSNTAGVVDEGIWTQPIPGSETQTATVSTTIASVTVPAGKFTSCYEITTEIDSVTLGTYDTIAWAAPNVGDVQYATVDSSGNQTVVLQLQSYHIP
jgi:hypothetical protein